MSKSDCCDFEMFCFSDNLEYPAVAAAFEYKMRSSVVKVNWQKKVIAVFKGSHLCRTAQPQMAACQMKGSGSTLCTPASASTSVASSLPSSTRL